MQEIGNHVAELNKMYKELEEHYNKGNKTGKMSIF